MSQIQETSFHFSPQLQETLEGLQKTPRSKERVTLKFEVSPGFDELLKNLANEIGTDEGDVFRRAIALYLLAMDAKKQGQKLGVVGPDQDALLEIEV